jgi:hypothetical protein
LVNHLPRQGVEVGGITEDSDQIEVDATEAFTATIPVAGHAAAISM